MLATVQRVLSAKIIIDDQVFSSIDEGCLVFICFEKNDLSQNIIKMVKKIINFRMLDGPKGLTSLALQSPSEEVLIVSQFTLAAITNKGNKPSFHKAAKPDDAKLMYDKFVSEFKNLLPKVKEGKFGSHMQINLVNKGPMTFNFKI